MSDVEREARELAEKLRFRGRYGHESEQQAGARRYEVAMKAADMLESLSKPSPTREVLEEIYVAQAIGDYVGQYAGVSLSASQCDQIAYAIIRNLKSLPPSPSVNEDKG